MIHMLNEYMDSDFKKNKNAKDKIVIMHIINKLKMASVHIFWDTIYEKSELSLWDRESINYKKLDNIVHNSYET